jgi:hypothetical protein
MGLRRCAAVLAVERDLARESGSENSQDEDDEDHRKIIIL